MLKFLIKVLLFKLLFKLRIAPRFVKLRVPQPGELWRIDEPDPFEPTITAFVKEIRAGWVQYSLGASGPDSLPISEFAAIYRFYRAKL